MADKSSIEWTDATWNPVTGCAIASPGCANCYAMRLAGTRLQHHPSRAGLTTPSKAGPVWNGQVRLNREWLDQPIRWKRPRRVFVCAHGDLFAENVPDEWIDLVFAVMAVAPQHTFQVLTKRAARMLAYFAKLQAEARAAGERTDVVPTRIDDAAADLTTTHGGALEEVPWPLPNVWLGVSAEDQTRANERVPYLCATPAAVRFVSVEPLIGEIDVTALDIYEFLGDDRPTDPDEPQWLFDALSGSHYFESNGYTEGGDGPDLRPLDWIIAGGESGPGARPMHPEWVRAIRDDCARAGVPFFFKQWGAWAPGECVTRATGVVDTADWFDGRWDYDKEDMREIGHVDDEPDLYRIGKAAAGRILDGETHSHFPAVSHG